jgi:hypothetical protein
VVLHRLRRLHGGGGDPRRRRWWNWGSSKRVGVLGRQREAQAIEHEFK